ncbi:hypothetical protein [Roseomonas populi]|uniref:Uncharacterized protein n=1 Tax=Roseomonas populi TaxID=3121582 RepID=A0ABT1X7L6_9PROT|nr:hypothetical protein [Roseomonas pecuniae]MCR0984101.1 hypothetical protein [Roseomonas pecuniae]
MNTFVSRPTFEKEFNYYRRLCNEMGKDIQRIQEDRERLMREVRRYQVQSRLDRDLAHITGSVQDIATLVARTLDAVVEHSLCKRALILREREPGSAQFDVLAAAGFRDLSPKIITHIDNPPAFGHCADGHCFPSNASALFKALNKLAGPGAMIWNYDRETGFAILITGTVGPIDIMFQQQGDDLTSIALHRIVDGLWRLQAREVGGHFVEPVEQKAIEAPQTANPNLEPLSVDTERPTIKEMEIVGQIERGGHIREVVVLSRDESEYAVFVLPSWGSGFRQVRTYRGLSVKVYKDFRRLGSYVRTTCQYRGCIIVMPVEAARAEKLRAAVPDTFGDAEGDATDSPPNIIQ